jgi:hypothetical protein
MFQVVGIPRGYITVASYNYSFSAHLPNVPQENLGRISDIAALAGIMGKNVVWTLGEPSNDMNLIPEHGDVDSRRKYVNGMGRVGLYIPESARELVLRLYWLFF